jgi:thioredoxin
MAFDAPIYSNDQSFDRVLNAGLPVMVFFYAGSTTSALEDTLKRLAKADAGNVIFVKLRTDENPVLAQRFSIRAPTVITFQHRDEAARTENPTSSDLEAHAAFAAGRAPKPVSAAPPRGERPEPKAAPFPVTDNSFSREVLNASLPVMVDFWAPWCGPCRMVAPALDKLASEYAGRVRIAKLNVDENPRTAAQYQVQGIPTLLLVKNGRVVDRIVGALPETQLRAQVERLLNTH